MTIILKYTETSYSPFWINVQKDSQFAVTSEWLLVSHSLATLTEQHAVDVDG